MNLRITKKDVALGATVLLCSLLLFNCETEEDLLPYETLKPTHTNRTFERHIVPLKSLETEHFDAFQLLSKLSSKPLNSEFKNQENYSEEYGLFYKLDKISVIESEDYEQFSFVVRSLDQQDNQFKNYLLYVYPNDQYQQFLITYQYESLEKETYHPISIIELQGSQLLTRNILNCPNSAQLVPETGTVCTYTLCTGTNSHMYGQEGCTCGHTDPCIPATETCTTQTYYVWQCGGGSGDTGSDDGSNDTGQTGGGDNTSGNDSDNDAPVIPLEDEETPMDRILECMNTMSFTGPNVTMPQSLIDSLSNSSRCQIPLDQFISLESCTFENKNFSIEAGRACLNGYEVDYSAKIISNLIGKEKCLNDHLTESGNDFIQNLLGNFEGAGSEFGIKIESKPNVYNSSGDHINGKTKFISGSQIVQIEISTFKANSNKALQVVRTLIHEYIHAEMFRKLNTDLELTQEDLDFKEVFESFENGNFQASSQHETMAELYVNEMANALKNFHQSIMFEDYNFLSQNGQISLDNFYEALAWQGLRDHDVQAWSDLPQSEKDQINQAYNTHIFSTTSNCPN